MSAFLSGILSEVQVPDSSLLIPEGGVMGAVETGVRAWVEGFTGMGPDSQDNVLISVLAVFLIYGLRKVVLRIVDRKVNDPKLVYQWSKTSSYVALLLSVVMVGTIWLEGLRSLGTFLGLLSAGVAIALKDVVASVAGWAFILWRRPFQLGDRIQLGPQAGDVVDLRPFQFTLLEIGNWVAADQSTGRIIHVPNFLVFTEPLYNYTAQFEFIWNELPILLTFESDWRKAKGILQKILDERVGETVKEAERAMKTASKKFFIYFSKLTPTVYTSVEDSGVLLTLRFICRARLRRGAAEEIWEAVLVAFAEASDIDFAYPTTRMYHNPLEGKKGARIELPP
ncbi:MAG: mechanosensitive ion channel family protein, partial [Longimicrobiales bacterium]|nr:mechanosensitive ion channel family protein [Longimicrobiales bacterium]